MGIFSSWRFSLCSYIRLIALNQTFVTFIGDRNYNFYVFPGNLPYPTLDQMGFSATCVFDLRAEWKRLYDDGSEEVIASACLRSEPGWMEEHRENLQELKIGDLMLVGAHDAVAYREYQDIGDDNWATSAVFAQEEDLLHQLIWGVRFLDIRAGFYPTTDERFWLVHGIRFVSFTLKEDASEDAESWSRQKRRMRWRDVQHTGLERL